MIATFVNVFTVITGSILGILFGKRIKDGFRETVYNGIGIFTVLIGIKMGLQTQKILYVAFSLILGGLLGSWWDIEGAIIRLGEYLKSKFSHEDDGKDFGYAFLNASVLFCIGAMSLVGSFKAGTEGDYSIILTKSVMDGFMSIIFAAAMGIGVAFSALTVLIYQGGLTLLAVYVRPFVSEVMLSELTAVGGAMIMMIGLNLLGLKKIKTGNYLPALILIVVFLVLEQVSGFSI